MGKKKPQVLGTSWKSQEVCLLLNTGQVGNKEQVLSEWRCWDHPAALQSRNPESCSPENRPKYLQTQEKQDGEALRPAALCHSGILWRFTAGKGGKGCAQGAEQLLGWGQDESLLLGGVPSTSQCSALSPQPLLHCPPHPGTKSQHPAH